MKDVHIYLQIPVHAQMLSALIVYWGLTLMRRYCSTFCKRKKPTAEAVGFAGIYGSIAWICALDFAPVD